MALNKTISPLLLSFCFFLCFLWAFAYSSSIPKQGVINDEAVELLQAQDLPLDRFYYFAPAYRDANVDLIESLVPYLHKLSAALFGQGLRVVHFMYALFYSFACALFYLLLKNIFQDRSFALFGTLFLTASSYAAFYNRILTRNGISLFWTCLILLILWRIVTTKPDDIRSKVLSYCTLALVLNLGMLSYTSFKFVVAAVYLSLGGRSLLLSQRKRVKRREQYYVAFSLALSLLLLFLLLRIGQTPLRHVIFRGNYVLKGDFAFQAAGYLKHLSASLLLPLRYPDSSDFLIDVTHIAYGRHSLSLLLMPFWGLGVWETFRRAHQQTTLRHFQALLLCVYGIGVALLALGGPSLKHHYALFPIAIFFSVCGLRSCYKTLSMQMSTKNLTSLTAGLALMFLLGEGRHLTRKIPANGLLRQDSGLPAASAKVALQNSGFLSEVYVIEGWGRDAVRWYTRQQANIHHIFNTPALPKEITRALRQRKTIGIIIQGDAEPVFFQSDPALLACFVKQRSSGDQWWVTTYIAEYSNCAMSSP